LGHFERKFYVDGDIARNPSIWTVRWRNDVAPTLPLEVFTQRNFVVDFFDRSCILLVKTAKSRFVPPFGGLMGNVHGSSVAGWKARGRRPISTN